MAVRVEVHKPPETDNTSVEILKKRDAKLIKKAIGRQATDSSQARAVNDALNQQNINSGLELEKNQLETVQKALGKLATEKGITKIPQRYKSKRLNRQIQNARKQVD